MKKLSKLLNKTEGILSVNEKEKEMIEAYVNDRMRGVSFFDVLVSYTYTRYRLKIDNVTCGTIYINKKRDICSTFEALVNKNGISLNQNGSYLELDVPTARTGDLLLGDIIDHLEKVPKNAEELLGLVGLSADGEYITINLADESAPHLLIAGSTGSGKTECVHTILTSLLFRYSPKELELCFIDPKRLGANTYKDIPHVKAIAVEPDGIQELLEDAIVDMKKRYNIIEESGYNSVNQYNALMKKNKKKGIPNKIIVIDEADDILSKRRKDIMGEIPELVRQLGQMGRAAGVHVILISQKPIGENIPSTIMTHFPGRIALRMTTPHDSRSAIGKKDAMHLTGKGDAIIKHVKDGAEVLTRIQVAYIPPQERKQVLEYIRKGD